MKDNYQDFNDDGQKDSLSFPKFNTNYDNNSERNSTDNNTKEKYKNNNEENNIFINNNNQNEDDLMASNLSKFKEQIELKDKKIEMKDV